MQKIYPAIQALGGDVIAVSFEPPAQVAAFLAQSPQPFRVLSDPERKAYQAFGLGRTSFWGILRPGVLWRYLKLMFEGWQPRKPGAQADLWQLGGDFIVDREGKVVFAYPSANATDRPSNEMLMDGMRKAV